MNDRKFKAAMDKAVRRGTRLLSRDIPIKAEKALTIAAITVANKALEYTPMEYSALVNSQYREVKMLGGKAVASIGYTQGYAAALHERTDWSPRPVEDKKGPAWNPSAKPKFLQSAGEEMLPEVSRHIKVGMRL